ncbi:MAG TPA: G1 family glutamic endopeptidase [Trebonia sp.]|jgi:hypothetical protein|nr:G1 family glutamic endopeptidase [Trebonia sp.]
MRCSGRLGRLAAGVAAAVVLAGISAGTAAASPVTSRAPATPEATSTSPIASGYAATPKGGGATSFTSVQDTFTVPRLNCASTPNGTAQMRAGLGPIISSMYAQVGLSETCTNGVASYVTWYAYYPVTVNSFSPEPGDALSSSVSYSVGTYTLSMQDLTSGQSFSIQQKCTSTCPNASAEVTAGSAKGTTPADFTVVNFAAITVTGNTGGSGGLSNANWATNTYVQSGTPHTVAGTLLTSTTAPAQSAFQDTWVS